MPMVSHRTALLLSCSLLLIFPYSANGVTSRAQFASAVDQMLLSSSSSSAATVASGSASSESSMESAMVVSNEGSLAIEPTGHHHQHKGSHVDLSSPKVIMSALTACALVACTVIVVYKPQGPVVITTILLYISALGSMKLTVKLVFSNFGFQFPEFLTAGHLILSSTVGFTVLFCRQYFDKTKVVPVPTSREFLFRIVPIAGAFALSLATNNNGLKYCTVAYAEVVGATSPLVTVAITLLLGLPFKKMLLAPTFVVVLGCVMSVGGETKVSLIGTMFIFAANISRALKSTMQQDLLTGETREKFDPCALLAWTCFASAFILVAWSIIFEGWAPIVALVDAQQPFSLVLAIFGSCLNACMLNLMVLHVTKELGAVGQVIAGQVASVFTVGGGIIIFGDHFTLQQGAGFLGVMCGAFWFSRISKKGHHGAGASEPEKTPLKKDADAILDVDKIKAKIKEPSGLEKEANKQEQKANKQEEN